MCLRCERTILNNTHIDDIGWFPKQYVFTVDNLENIPIQVKRIK